MNNVSDEANNGVASDVTDDINKTTVVDNDNTTAGSTRRTTDSDSSSSNSDSTLIITEDNTEIVQVKPMESLTVNNSNNFQSQPMGGSSKESVQDDSVTLVTDQSTLTQSCEQMSETVTYSINQPETIGKCLRVYYYYK